MFLNLRKTTLFITTIILIVFVLIGYDDYSLGPVRAQQPTGSVPTVTGTRPGPYITVYAYIPQVRVYSGPSSYSYPPVGILLAGQQVPALGKSANGEWVLVRYVGIPSKQAWVYSPFVSLSSSNIPIVEAPPLPTARTTPTIDPTLAAAFPILGTSTRLPTFTPPSTLSIPNFSEDDSAETAVKFPLGLAIFGLVLLGFFGAMIALTRGR